MKRIVPLLMLSLLFLDITYAQEPPKKFTAAQIKYTKEYVEKNKDTQDPLQMFSIGAMHWRGMTGKVDRKTAFEFFTRSSKVPRLGNEQAANVLAKVYFYGESHEKFGVKGIKKDVKKAAALCLQSAEWGFLPSIGTIAHFYDVGIGVEKDLVKALAWHKVTLQKHPHEHAKERIAALQKELTPEQLAASEKLAKEITAKIEARKPTKKTGI